LLFVGTNPRISDTNKDLYAEIMRKADSGAGPPPSFHLLAQDVWQGRSYLRFGEPGHHYDLHLAIAERAFPGRLFSSVAAVTELFLCATEDATSLPRTGSTCADLYLDRVARQVQPRVVVAVGAPARKYLAVRRICGGSTFKARIGDSVALVAPVPHPAEWGVKNRMNAYIQWAAEVIGATIRGESTFPRPPRASGGSFTQSQFAAWLIHSNPRLTARELTAELAVAFPPPAYNVGARHGAHYLSKYRTGKLDVPQADPRGL
jgi:hypothetical protein